MKQALSRQGIDTARADAVGMGENKPIADNMTSAGRLANRRVEITLLNKSVGR